MPDSLEDTTTTYPAMMMMKSLLAALAILGATPRAVAIRGANSARRVLPQSEETSDAAPGGAPGTTGKGKDDPGTTTSEDKISSDGPSSGDNGNKDDTSSGDEFGGEYATLEGGGSYTTLGPYVALLLPPVDGEGGQHLTYQQAQGYCQEKFGTSLASLYRGDTSDISALDQFEMMQNLAESGGKKMRFWVGLRSGQGGSFVWENGQAYQSKQKFYQFWRNGSVDAGTENGRCAMFAIDDVSDSADSDARPVLNVCSCFVYDFPADDDGYSTMALCDSPDPCNDDYCGDGQSCDTKTSRCVPCGGDSGETCGNGAVCSKDFRQVDDGEAGNMCVTCIYTGEEGPDIGCDESESCYLDNDQHPEEGGAGTVCRSIG